MKISGEGPKISGIYDRPKKVGKVDKSTNVESSKDGVSISKDASKIAKDYKTVMSSLKDVPDIREDKVQEISDKYQKKLESGEHWASSNEIVGRMLESLQEKK
jgi:negative regulator of flagellin synthesis FlgM